MESRLRPSGDDDEHTGGAMRTTANELALELGRMHGLHTGANPPSSSEGTLSSPERTEWSVSPPAKKAPDVAAKDGVQQVQDENLQQNENGAAGAAHREPQHLHQHQQAGNSIGGAVQKILRSSSCLVPPESSHPTLTPVSPAPAERRQEIRTPPSDSTGNANVPTTLKYLRGGSPPSLPTSSGALLKPSSAEVWYNTVRERQESDLANALRSNGWLVEELARRTSQLEESKALLKEKEAEWEVDRRELGRDAVEKTRIFDRVVAGLRADFAKCEDEFSVREEAGKRVNEAQCETLRQEVLQAEDDVRKKNVVISTLKAEISTLREKLCENRDVTNKALMSAKDCVTSAGKKALDQYKEWKCQQKTQWPLDKLYFSRLQDILHTIEMRCTRLLVDAQKRFAFLEEGAAGAGGSHSAASASASSSSRPSASFSFGAAARTVTDSGTAASTARRAPAAAPGGDAGTGSAGTGAFRAAVRSPTGKNATSVAASSSRTFTATTARQDISASPRGRPAPPAEITRSSPAAPATKNAGSPSPQPEAGKPAAAAPVPSVKNKWLNLFLDDSLVSESAAATYLDRVVDRSCRHDEKVLSNYQVDDTNTKTSRLSKAGSTSRTYDPGKYNAQSGESTGKVVAGTAKWTDRRKNLGLGLEN